MMAFIELYRIYYWLSSPLQSIKMTMTSLSLTMDPVIGFGVTEIL